MSGRTSDMRVLLQTATRAAKKQAPGAVGQAGDDDVQVEYVFEGDPEPEGGQKPLAQMTVDFTPDDGVEDDDSAGAWFASCALAVALF